MSRGLTPTDMIEALDGDLTTAGQDIILQRLTLGPGGTQIVFEAVCRAKVMGYTPQELVGGITQDNAQVIISATEINRTGWPGPATKPTSLDRRVPSKSLGDKVIINGKQRAVEAAVGIYPAGELVRIEIRVLG